MLVWFRVFGMKKIDLPRFSERIRGFTLPVDGMMYAFDYDEVFRLNLTMGSLEILNDDPYAFADANPGFLGVSGFEPLLANGSSTVSYCFDPAGDSQDVCLIWQGQRHDITFRTLSGDWFVATLTANEKYLIIAEPYLLEVYALVT